LKGSRHIPTEISRNSYAPLEGRVRFSENVLEAKQNEDESLTVSSRDIRDFDSYAESVRSSDPDVTYMLFEGKSPSEADEKIIKDMFSNASTTSDSETFWTDDTCSTPSEVEAFFSHSFLIDDETEEYFWVDHNNVLRGYFPVDRNTKEITASDRISKAPEIKAARVKELKQWVDNQTMTPQLREEFEKETGIRPIPSRWVEIWKIKQGQVIAKARLCLKGFAEPLDESESNSSPTANRFSHRIVMTLAVNEDWRIASMDVSAAFLRGFNFSELEQKGMKRRPVGVVPCEDVMSLLAEIDPKTWGSLPNKGKGYILRLLKAAYGLRDAPLLWHLKAVEALIKLSFRQLKHDTCVFVRYHDNQAICIVTLHVDDLLVTGLDKFILELHKSLSDVFGELTIDFDNFKHFGIDVVTAKDADGNRIITASQKAYIDEISPIEMPTKYAKVAKVPPEIITLYRSLASGIAWVGVTDPTAVSSASLLQTFLPELSWADIERINHNLFCLKRDYQPLQFQKIAKPWKLLEISDSSFANVGKYSQMGFLLLLCTASDTDLCGKFCLLHWKSNKSKRVTTSTMHAETVAKCTSLENAQFIQGLIYEICFPSTSVKDLIEPKNVEQLLPIVSMTDCEDLHSSLMAPATTQSGSMHLMLYLASLKEYRTTSRVIAYGWLDTRDMLANALTKLNADGSSNRDELGKPLCTFFFNPSHAYKWNTTWCYP